MFLIRKLGSILRGKATRGQILLATILGGLLGFVPGFFVPGNLGGGFLQAPGLILLLVFLLLVLNANFGVFALTTVLAKLLSIPLLAVSFAIGQLLLDGPLQPLFKLLINSPVTAWFGLEYYATSGGLVLGLVVGVLAGVLLNRTLTAIRAHMASVETTSERYQKYAQKRSVRLCSWLFLGGGKGRKSWQELADDQRFGRPVRLTGIALVLLLGGGMFVFQQWFSTPLLTSGLRSGLTAANGATVDLEQARLDLAGGSLHIHKLAMADAKALGQDLFAADDLVATIDSRELLRKRLVIDELRSASARTGSPRATPGVLTPAPAPPPEPPPAAGSKTIDDYLKDVELWKQRLQQARDWMQKLCGGDKTPAAKRTPAEIKQEIERKRQEVGMARVIAEHLLEGAPSLLIRKLDFENVGITIDGTAELLDLRGRNLSTAPSLVADAASFGITSKSDKLKFLLAGPTAGSGQLGLEFAWRRLPVDQVFGQLKLAGAAPVRGGTMDLASNGTFTSKAGAPLTMELPLQVTLKNTTFALAGSKETKVEQLLLPIGVRGAVTRPTIALDDKALGDALVQAGKAELANFVKGQAGKLLGGAVPGVEQLIDPNKSPQQLLDEARQKAEEAAKKAAADAAKKAAEDAATKGLKGLLPGKKSDPPKKQ